MMSLIVNLAVLWVSSSLAYHAPNLIKRCHPIHNHHTTPLPTMLLVVVHHQDALSFGSTDKSYVTARSVFPRTLTVRETLTYAAQLRHPANMTKNEIDKVVTKTLDEMGLQDIANSRLGNWHLRGISNGEKRRLSIGIELLTQPHIMFMDEPTSGLDSAAAFYVILSLRSIAHDGRIVICSIHQPSSEVFNLFDDLVILAGGGETVYLGKQLWL
ncbi:P-loop containing nucleoside triphosphate hydrolase [Sesbania bispinosa]|nr:P-loop containing nucleoside triphosphate hydrolase [Sesbania bispinosa]